MSKILLFPINYQMKQVHGLGEMDSIILFQVFNLTLPDLTSLIHLESSAQFLSPPILK